jgi:hypothetical protein
VISTAEMEMAKQIRLEQALNAAFNAMSKDQQTAYAQACGRVPSTERKQVMINPSDWHVESTEEYSQEMWRIAYNAAGVQIHTLNALVVKQELLLTKLREILDK